VIGKAAILSDTTLGIRIATDRNFVHVKLRKCANNNRDTLMIENVLPRESLRPLCRRKFKRTESRTVVPAEVEALATDGWQTVKKNKSGVRLERKKPHSKDLEDRVWALFYRMGFPYLSGDGGASVVNSQNDPVLTNQIDCVAIDAEVALGVECKSSVQFAKRPRLQEEIAKIAGIRSTFSKAANGVGGNDNKRSTVMCMFLSNASLSDTDTARAKESNVVLFDDNDLEYYEKLVSHLGPAARYQFLADLLPGKDIPGLKIRLPAIKFRLGGGDAYMFAISPEYLLKVSYVSHRSKGKGSDIDTYQRMMKRSRLRKIHEFIEEKGTFPTNIVVNVDSRRLQFYKTKQEGEGDTESGVLGWLDIRPAYKSAWIIDGQHRLFGYSGSKLASKARLAVLAFAGLKPSDQAGMFININSKQKSVKQSLLQELYAELHWDAEDPRMRVRAVISKAIQFLDGDKISPFFGKIQTADSGRDERRCISLTSIFGALEKSDFYVANEKSGHVIEYGALWEPDNDATLKRTVYVLNTWFSSIKTAVPEWWNIGSGEGGGLSMNDGVVSLIGVLRSVLSYLRETKKLRLPDLSCEELGALITPYGKTVGAYLASFSTDQRRKFRDLRGVQGVTTRQRRIQQALHATNPDFNPIGLEEFLRNEKAETNKHAKDILDKIELLMQSTILAELKQQYGSEETGWWFRGVPQPVRKDVSARVEEDSGKRGGKEYYFNLIHYRSIITANWQIFDKIFGYGKKNVGKEKGTEWIKELNEFRNIVAHPTSGTHISMEELATIARYHDWLENRSENPDAEDEAQEAATGTQE
jgi:DNA sulfur modification protein DndB